MCVGGGDWGFGVWGLVVVCVGCGGEVQGFGVYSSIDACARASACEGGGVQMCPSAPPAWTTLTPGVWTPPAAAAARA